MASTKSDWLSFLNGMNPLAARQEAVTRPQNGPLAAMTYAHTSGSRKKDEFVMIGLGRFGLTAIAVRRGEELLVSPSANFRIEPNDILVVLGKIEDAERLSQ